MFRNGQWVKGRLRPTVRVVVGTRVGTISDPAQLAAIAAVAQAAADEQLVGIHVAGGRDSTGNASLGGVDLVQHDTGNAVRFVHDGQAVAVRLTLDSFEHLEAITDRADLPAGREYAEGWEPRA